MIALIDFNLRSESFLVEQQSYFFSIILFFNNDKISGEYFMNPGNNLNSFRLKDFYKNEYLN